MNAPSSQGLYLFHFTPRYQHAGHRLGWASNIARRVDEHLGGGRRGSPLVRAAMRAGCRVELARVWDDGSRSLEARLKRQGGLSRHCPICRATGTYHR